MKSAFKPWVGQSVILQVALGDIKVPCAARCCATVIESVRMRIGEGYDVDIYKEMIMAVEQDALVALPA